MIHAVFCDQELNSYHYWSCCCCWTLSCSCWGDAVQKSPSFRCFKSDCYGIWQDCSSSKCASIDSQIS